MSRFVEVPLQGDFDRALAGEADGIVYNASGTRPPLVCIRTWSTENDHYVSLARALGPDQPIVTLAPPDHPKLEAYPRTTDEWVDWLLPTYRALGLQGDRLLGGFSFGGVVALELAERLAREGEPVALVLMLDTRRPKARPETKPGAKVPLRLRRFARQLLAYCEIETRTERLAFLRAQLDPRRILAKRAARHDRREARRARKAGKRERRAADVARAFDRRPVGMVATRFTGEQMSYLQRTVHVVYLKYRAHETELPIALLRTAESVERAGDDPALGWHPLARGPFSAETIAGTHWTLFEPAHLPALAVRIDGALRRALDAKRSALIGLGLALVAAFALLAPTRPALARPPVSGVGASSAATPASASAPRAEYRVLYTAWLDAGEPIATVRIRLASHPEWVRWMRLRADPARYRDFKGSGRLEFGDGEITWIPPGRDAWLQYRVNLTSRREGGRYDGRVTDSWALFRADDLVPPIHIDMEDGTQSKSKLKLELPEGWSVATPYPRYASGRFAIDNPARLFDRPTGWILAGRIGVRRETIDETRVIVAAPIGHGARRLDMLAFFRFTLPTLKSIFPALPERLLVVSAADRMWRGALSGPSSLFVHADRPLVSENATSTFLHELVHVAMGARGEAGADWLVEGLAEYYSLEVLRRSGAISERRYRQTHARLAEWAEEAGELDVARAHGAVTAKAVGVLRALDEELRRRSGRTKSLDDVVRSLPRGRAVSVAGFRSAAEVVAGGKVSSLPKP